MDWKVNPEKCQDPGCNEKMTYDPGYGIMAPRPGEKRKVDLTCPKGHKYEYLAIYRK
jgi:hypothetical protein